MITTICKASRGIQLRSIIVATLSELRTNAGSRQTSSVVNILTQNAAGNWVLSLPSRMRDSQDELENLLARAFSGRPRCQSNLELAQQLTINWCISKCRKQGLPFEEFFPEAN
jgi:hypothetical protein